MPSNEYALVMLKPDGVRKNIVNEVKQALRERGLRILEQRYLRLSLSDLQSYFHYDFPEYREYMLSGPCLALLISGNDAVHQAQCMREGIRSRHGVNGPADTRNLVHVAEGGFEFHKQLALCFPDAKPCANYADMYAKVTDKSQAGRLFRFLDRESQISVIVFNEAPDYIPETQAWVHSLDLDRIQTRFSTSVMCEILGMWVEIIVLLPKYFDSSLLRALQKDLSLRSIRKLVLDSGYMVALGRMPFAHIDHLPCDSQVRDDYLEKRLEVGRKRMIPVIESFGGFTAILAHCLDFSFIEKETRLDMALKYDLMPFGGSGSSSPIGGVTMTQRMFQPFSQYLSIQE